MKVLLVVLLMTVSLTASASKWHYDYGDDHKHYIIDGRKGEGSTNRIEVKDRKSGKKLAKKLNKIKKKDDKKGFWNPREEFCADPQNEC